MWEDPQNKFGGKWVIQVKRLSHGTPLFDGARATVILSAFGCSVCQRRGG